MNSMNRARVLVLAGIVLIYPLFISGLSTNPPGFFVDDSCMAYSGYLIATTGRDLNGVSFPLFVPCYADEYANWLSTEFVYMLAAMYLVIPPSMLSAHVLSATLVYIAMLLIGLLAARVSGNGIIGVIVGLTAIVTPWLFELSRLVQETSVLVLAVVIFLLCLQRAYRRGNWTVQDDVLIALSLAMITYAYAGGRVLGPVFALGLLIFAVNKHQLFEVFKTWVMYGLLFMPTLVVYFTRNDVVVKRFRETTFFDPQEPVLTNIGKFIYAYFQDISPSFLLLNGDIIPRHHIPENGEMLAATFLLAVVGLIIVLRHFRGDAWWRFVIYGLAVSVLPGAITLTRYHTLRLLAVPVFLLILTVPALSWLMRQREEGDLTRSIYRRIALCGLLVLTLVQAIVFQMDFREEGPKRLYYFNAAYPKVFEKALAQPTRPIYLQDGYYGPQYIHALWYGTLKGIDLKELIRIPSDATPPPDSVVLSAAKTCTRCNILFQEEDVTLYRTWADESSPDPAGGANIITPLVIGKEGADAGQFAKPSGVASDKNGGSYVADSNNSRIQKFDSYADIVSTFGSKGTSEGEIMNPVGIAIDDEGNIFVTDASRHKLIKFDSEGNHINEWDGGAPTFYGPRDIAVGPDDQLYLIDSGLCRVAKFDPVSETFAFWGAAGKGEGEFAGMTGITVAGDNVVVVEADNKRIQIFDLDGNFVRQWHISAWEDMVPKNPDVAFDDRTKTLYISNDPARDILAFDLEGNPRPGIKLDGEEQFVTPTAMSISDVKGRRFLRVVDTGSSKIFIFDIGEPASKK